MGLDVTSSLLIINLTTSKSIPGPANTACSSLSTSGFLSSNFSGSMPGAYSLSGSGASSGATKGVSGYSFSKSVPARVVSGILRLILFDDLGNVAL